MITSKEIRNKIYLWIQKKGVVLDKKDYKELSKLLKELGSCVNPAIQVKPKSLSKPKEVISDWKPYPLETE